MPLRTDDSLKKLFEASRARQQRLKEQETKKYRKAQETVKKALDDKLSTDKEKTPQKAQEQQIEVFSRAITIYNSKYIERFADENELYTTREELEKAMPHCINWTLWDKLIEETKKSI